MFPAASTLPISEAPILTYDHSSENIAAVIGHAQTSGIEHSIDSVECISKSSTRHSTAQADEVPDAVLYPKTTEDVSNLVRVCHERNIAVSAFGGGTSLGGALTTTRGGICIDFKYMDKILQVHEDDLDVVVQPNVGWVELNQLLEGSNLFFPPDPAPGAKIGGMV
jgi:D-lactate dehydrogenase (cytochrome)